MTHATDSERVLTALAAGQCVRLQGLISRSDLNGTLACISEASTSAEREKLEKEGRVKVTGLSAAGAPTGLSVKRENIVALGAASVDWTFCDSPPLSLLELVRAPGARARHL